jgi:hypothetical protein
MFTFFRSVRVLQYRSVAFVTYVSEFHAQFAKEAMACQSLDNDEILNVRWATEDPNPVQKVAEKRRLEDMGQEAIKARMDPRIVDAMRAVRALEDGVMVDDDVDGQDGQDGYIEEQDEPESKRRRLDLESDDVHSETPSPSPPKPAGLLSSDTLEGLKYFAQIRSRHGLPLAQHGPPPLPSKTVLGLADYGSDEDD